MNDQDRNKKITDILDREDYREQTPRKLMAAIEEVDGHAQRSKCPYCPAPPSQFTSLENCPGFVRCENCECEFLLVPKASAILTPAASDGVKDLAIEVARERIAELINERDQALSLVESMRASLNLAYVELKQHAADYHHRTSTEINNKIVDALGLSDTSTVRAPE